MRQMDPDDLLHGWWRDGNPIVWELYINSIMPRLQWPPAWGGRNGSERPLFQRRPSGILDQWHRKGLQCWWNCLCHISFKAFLFIDSLPKVMSLTGFSKLVKVVKKKNPQESKKEELKEEEQEFEFTLPAAFESQLKRWHHFVVLWAFDDWQLAMIRIVIWPKSSRSSGLWANLSLGMLMCHTSSPNKCFSRNCASIFHAMIAMRLRFDMSKSAAP